jgi:hypothetical protein
LCHFEQSCRPLQKQCKQKYEGRAFVLGAGVLLLEHSMVNNARTPIISALACFPELCFTVTALRAGTRLRIRLVHKLLICILVNKLLTITRRNFSKANMGLSNLPLELLGLILANIFPNEWNHCNNRREVLSLRTVCRKYLNRVS